MIKLKKDNNFDEKFRDRFQIIVDNERLENSYADKWRSRNAIGYEIRCSSEKEARKLLAYDLTSFPNIVSISFPLVHFEYPGFFVDIWLTPKTLKGFWEISLYLIPKYKLWKESYDYISYEEKFIKLIKSSVSQNIRIHTYNNEEVTIGIESDIEMGVKPLFEEIKPFLYKIKTYHEQTAQELSGYSSLINVSFEFPEELKTSCEQYLLYFAQFLKDLGINAASNLTEDAGKLLFSVTPTDDIEALDKIRDALAIYLDLPSSPIVYNESFAAMRLQQQIENLQHSQKMAARELQVTEKLLIAQSETIQEKNIIISQKDSLIQQQNKIIEKITSKSIMMDSLENKTEFEKIFNGLEVGESKFIKEQIGIKFNPATSLKTLGKKLIGKDDEITSLNLSEKRR